MSILMSGSVGTVLKQTLAAGAASVGFAGFFKALRHVSSTGSDQAWHSMQEYLEKYSPGDRHLFKMEGSLLELMDRMKLFANFAPKEYTEMIDAALGLLQEKVRFQEKVNRGRVLFQDAKRIRAVAQTWIESIRLFRAILEIEKPNTLEDFDDVAVDCQAYFNEIAEGALLDSQLYK